MKRLLLHPLILVMGMVAFAPLLQAQVANYSALVGTVFDSSGSAVAGAKVTAVEESTGVVYPGATDEQRLLFDQIHSSRYLRYYRRAADLAR